MANPQPTDSHLRISHAISEELMMRDFSKRQRSILDFILRLSWGCGKKQAIIPKLQDFEICGISKTKIKQELNYLVNANVIQWIKEMNLFSFNKDYDTWKISIVPGYNKERLSELIHINLNKVPKTGTKLPKQQETSRTEGNNVPKKEELPEGSSPPISTADGVPIESIIESNTVSSIGNNMPPPLYDATLQRMVQAYENSGFGRIHKTAADTLLDYSEMYTEEWTVMALEKATLLGKRNLKYVGAILRGWEAAGEPQTDDLKPVSPKSKYQVDSS